jgi:MFS family permease
LFEFLKNKNIKNLFFMDLFINTSRGAYEPFLSLYMKSVGLSIYNIGLISAVGSLVSAIFQIPVGWLLDRWGAKKMAFLGIILGTIPLVFFPFSTQRIHFYFLVTLIYLSVIILIPAREVYLTKIVLPHERSSGFGMLYALMPLGSTIGPLLGGFGADFFNDLRVPFIISLFINFSSIFFVLRLEEKKDESEDVDLKRTSRENTELKSLFSVVYPFTILGLIHGFTFVQLIYIPLFLTQKFGVSKSVIGLISSIRNILAIFAVYLGGRLGDTRPKKTTMLMSALMGIGIISLYPFAQSLGLFALSYILHEPISNIKNPIQKALMMGLISNRYGLAAATENFGWRIGHIMGSLTSGFLMETYGAPAFMYLLIVVSLFNVPAILIIRENEKKK